MAEKNDYTNINIRKYEWYMCVRMWKNERRKRRGESHKHGIRIHRKRERGGKKGVSSVSIYSSGLLNSSVLEKEKRKEKKSCWWWGEWEWIMVDFHHTQSIRSLFGVYFQKPSQFSLSLSIITSFSENFCWMHPLDSSLLTFPLEESITETVTASECFCA